MQNHFLIQWVVVPFGPQPLKFQSPEVESWLRLSRKCPGCRYLVWVTATGPCLPPRKEAAVDGISALCSFLLWREMTQVSNAGAEPSPADVIRARYLLRWFGHPIPLGSVLTKQQSAKSWEQPNGHFLFWEDPFSSKPQQLKAIPSLN